MLLEYGTSSQIHQYQTRQCETQASLQSNANLCQSIWQSGGTPEETSQFSMIIEGYAFIDSCWVINDAFIDGGFSSQRALGCAICHSQS